MGNVNAIAARKPGRSFDIRPSLPAPARNCVHKPIDVVDVALQHRNKSPVRAPARAGVAAVARGEAKGQAAEKVSHLNLQG
jgi:hypothetical protein